MLSLVGGNVVRNVMRFQLWASWNTVRMVWNLALTLCSIYCKTDQFFKHFIQSSGQHTTVITINLEHENQVQIHIIYKSSFPVKNRQLPLLFELTNALSADRTLGSNASWRFCVLLTFQTTEGWGYINTVDVWGRPMSPSGPLTQCVTSIIMYPNWGRKLSNWACLCLQWPQRSQPCSFCPVP